MNTHEAVLYKWNRLLTIGKLLVRLKAVRAYHDGDSVGFVWRVWNPISWVVAPLYIALHVIVEGLRNTSLKDCMLRIEPHFKTHPGFEWIDWKKRH
jgi:hypothetical protein